ncbi:hypothetical protein HAX54_037144, partial [Datura stramonium]|nr:hypothetical protein [Datura stramonium]
ALGDTKGGRKRRNPLVSLLLIKLSLSHTNFNENFNIHPFSGKRNRSMGELGALIRKSVTADGQKVHDHFGVGISSSPGLIYGLPISILLQHSRKLQLTDVS